MLKRIYEDSNLSSLHVNINEECSFKNIIIRISGTNGATPVTLADIGRINYYKNGVNIISADFDYLHAMNHMLGGNPFDNSTGSGALDFVLAIPRRYNDNNVDKVTSDDNANLKCAFNANLASRVASGGKVEVYLDTEDGIQKYNLAILQYSESVSAAQVRPIAIDQPNILVASVSDIVSSVLTLASSNITQINTTIGTEHSDSTLASVIGYTNCIYNLESDYSLACIPFSSVGDITSRLNDNIRFGITTGGSAEIQILVMSALFDPEAMQATRREQVAKLRSILARKTNIKQGNTITAINMLSPTALKR